MQLTVSSHLFVAFICGKFLKREFSVDMDMIHFTASHIDTNGSCPRLHVNITVVCAG